LLPNGVHINYDVHIIEQQQAISTVLAEDRRNLHKLSEFRVTEALCTVFQPFPALQMLCLVKNVTVSAIQPIMKYIVDFLTVTKNLDSRFIKEVEQYDKQ